MTATAVPSLSISAGRWIDRRVPARWLVGGLFMLGGIPQIALWIFLGLGGWPAIMASALLLAALIAGLTRPALWRAMPDPTLSCCLITFAFALTMFLLGGEGRFFYANTDWQVRGAVLHDLIAYPWPFAYAHPAGPQILRVPLSMYLMPAMVGKLVGIRAAEIGMLLLNSAMLAMILALGAQLYRQARERVIALAVVTLFSGMDIVGTLINGYRIDEHLEHWMFGAQFTAPVTQLFWVPQHGMAGWIGALFYLLWRAGQAPRVALLAWTPIAGLLSPLALIGLFPFAAHAGLDAVFRRQLTWRDVALPMLAVLLSALSLLYLTSGSSDGVGGHRVDIDLIPYCLFILIEVGPFLIAMRMGWAGQRFGLVAPLVMTAVLLLAPLGKIGVAVDFMMRVTIPSLTILSVIIADLMIRPAADTQAKLGRRIAIAALLIGAATPLSEIARALIFPRSPAVACSYLGVVPGGAPTYLAPVTIMPGWMMAGRPMTITPRDPARCWTGPWPDGEKVGLFDPIADPLDKRSVQTGSRH